jgi:hypothetical protein
VESTDVFTDNCLAAIEANRSRYEDLVTGERRDDSPFSDAGPGIPDASPTFPDAGPDGYLSERLTDLDDPESMIGRILLDGCAEAAGGYDALRSLDTEPLPSEKLEHHRCRRRHHRPAAVTRSRDPPRRRTNSSASPNWQP